MNALKENLKKYFTWRFLDLSYVVVVLYLFYIFMSKYVPFNSTNLIIAGTIFIFGVLWIIDLFISKQMKKWTVPEMNREEDKNYLLADTFMNIVIGVLIFAFSFYFLNYVLGYVVLLIVLVILIKEVPKWWKYLKIEMVD